MLFKTNEKREFQRERKRARFRLLEKPYEREFRRRSEGEETKEK